MDYRTITLEVSDRIATITLNRPEKLNALNPQMRLELADAFREVDRDDEARVLVITGAGRAFCAGADIKESFQAGIDRRKSGETDDITRSFSAVAPVLAGMDKPVIAAVNGYAVGWGCTVTLVCDIRIASDAAKFSVPFPRVGLAPEFGSTYFLSRIVGIAKACELVFTGKMIDAAEAGEIGLVNQVVPAGELDRVTREMAGTMAKMPPQAMRVSKVGLYQGLNSDLMTQLRYESYGINFLRGTKDFEEATKAFLAKREPVFTGK
jgi:2-(1,2-epoxy-1,2-dihydrophenyl)acetyl-CoA isomerase